MPIINDDVAHMRIFQNRDERVKWFLNDLFQRKTLPQDSNEFVFNYLSRGMTSSRKHLLGERRHADGDVWKHNKTKQNN